MPGTATSTLRPCPNLCTRKDGWLFKAEKKMSIDIVFPQPTLPYLDEGISYVQKADTAAQGYSLATQGNLVGNFFGLLLWQGADTSLWRFALERQSRWHSKSARPSWWINIHKDTRVRVREQSTRILALEDLPSQELSRNKSRIDSHKNPVSPSSLLLAPSRAVHWV